MTTGTGAYFNPLNSSMVIDLKEKNITNVPNYDYPKAIFGATGVFINGMIVICGGLLLNPIL